MAKRRGPLRYAGWGFITAALVTAAVTLVCGLAQLPFEPEWVFKVTGGVAFWLAVAWERPRVTRGPVSTDGPDTAS